MEFTNLSREEKKAYDLERIDALVQRNQGLAKTSDNVALGIDYRRILQFMEEGYLKRVKSGYYTSKYYEGSEEQMIAHMFPDGVLTMESALYYYKYLSQRPFAWHIAISKNVSKSRFNMDYPNLQPYYSEPKVLTMGVTTMEIGGETIQIYTKDRLVCECLKYQEKMSRDDFKKAVLTYINDDDKDVAALMEYAKERKVLEKVQNMIGIWL